MVINRILDIYSDYLIAQNQYATAVGLSDLLEGRRYELVVKSGLEKSINWGKKRVLNEFTEKLLLCPIG
jgi:hypothetical protein